MDEAVVADVAALDAKFDSLAVKFDTLAFQIEKLFFLLLLELSRPNFWSIMYYFVFQIILLYGL